MTGIMAANGRTERLYPTLPYSLLSMSSGEEEEELEEVAEVLETDRENVQCHHQQTEFHRWRSEPWLKQQDRSEGVGADSSSMLGKGSGVRHSAISLGEFEEQYFSEQPSSTPMRKRVKSPSTPSRRVHFSHQETGGMWKQLVGVVSGCGQSAAGTLSWRVWVVMICFVLGVVCAAWGGWAPSSKRGTRAGPVVTCMCGYMHMYVDLVSIPRRLHSLPSNKQSKHMQLCSV